MRFCYETSGEPRFALSPLLWQGLPPCDSRIAMSPAARKSLVIVESPAKAKTLEKFVGRDFRVLASYGHVRDLPRKGLGVDRAHGYEPTYEVLKGKAKTLAELKKAARDSPAVYRAADRDREREANSWHR